MFKVYLKNVNFAEVLKNTHKETYVVLLSIEELV